MNRMKTILVVLLCLNVFLLAGRFWQEAAAGSAFTPAGNGDVNADGDIDLSAPIYLITHLFQGGPAPVAIAQGVGLEEQLELLEARIASLENRATLSDLNCADSEIPKWDESSATWVCAVDEGFAAPDEIPRFTFVELNTEGSPEYTHDESGVCFVLLPGSKFDMGSPGDEPNRDTDEGPAHTVTLSPSLIAKYEVTQAEYAAVMAAHASLSAMPSLNFGSAPLDLQRPAENVNWNDLKDADSFLVCTGLS